MSIVLLFIPLVLFIAVEGVILYFLIDMVVSTLFDNNFSSSAIVDHAYPATQAILFITLLLAAVAVAIYFYVRLVIKPDLYWRKQKKAAEQKKLYAAYNNAYNNTAPPGSPQTISPNKLKVTGIPGPPPKKKSKLPLIIILAAVGVVILGAAALFILQPAWLPFDLPDLPFLGGGGTPDDSGGRENSEDEEGNTADPEEQPGDSGEPGEPEGGENIPAGEDPAENNNINESGEPEGPGEPAEPEAPAEPVEPEGGEENIPEPEPEPEEGGEEEVDA